MDISSNQIFYIANPDKYILSQHGRQKKKTLRLYYSLLHVLLLGQSFVTHLLLLLLHCCPTSTANIQDHAGTASQPNHTSPGQAQTPQAVNQHPAHTPSPATDNRPSRKSGRRNESTPPDRVSNT